MLELLLSVEMNQMFTILWKESATEWQVTNDGAHYHAIARKYAENIIYIINFIFCYP